jgi:hypothetical protein
MVEELIIIVEKLAFKMEDMSDSFFNECFIGGLNDEIYAQVLMARPQT